MSVPNTGSAEQDADSSLKRKRSPSLAQQPASLNTPPTKITKSSSIHHFSINYLARSSNDDLPLATKDDALQHILHILGLYSNVLDRHESLAFNLGARPLAPILIKRFERCFEAAPKIVASHQRSNGGSGHEPEPTATWLEVIEFARSHPSQFTLSTFSEGRRVCQFYLPSKQLRVQITEEDFLFINSGRCQELIPPLPIWEDEEKEVSTCDVLEARLKELTNVADMVAARTRQLCHRLKGRRAAILERRAEGGSGTPAKADVRRPSAGYPSSVTNSPAHYGKSADDLAKSSAAMRNELLHHFESLPQNQPASGSSVNVGNNNNNNNSNNHNNTPLPNTNGATARRESGARPSNSPRAVETSQQRPAVSQQADTSNPVSKSNHRNSIGSASSAPLKHNFSRPLAPAQESSQPFRPLCQAHMDNLNRGQRVIPPCDRCRRLKMDCVKNLTSCAGCTKKHARCHWRDVTRDELAQLDKLMEGKLPLDMNPGALRDATDEDQATGDDDEDDGTDDEDDADMPGNLVSAPRPLLQQQHDNTNRGTATDIDSTGRGNGGAEQSRPWSVINPVQRGSDISSRPQPRILPSSATTIRSVAQHFGNLDHVDDVTVAKPSSIGGFRAMTYITSTPPDSVAGQTHQNSTAPTDASSVLKQAVQ